MKKLGVIFAMLAVSLIIPATSFANGWDYQGRDVFTEESKIFKSGGGSFKFCLSSNSKDGTYRLYEEDPYSTDDWVPNSALDSGYDPTFKDGTFGSGNNCIVYRTYDIDEEVDGANDQAEFYIKKWTGGNSTVTVYD
ncbi:hypothetical protein [Halobacillus hunanensis]|uniref:hypothetical protein n=1 Tax=Halobacillus hunanensis TaxID=578214 RepID=UPI0009A6F49A|nr:hypothetical protein [Halobacillus hunanensis]